ncbi:MAG: FmdB family zinc ribbon protein [Polyangia bacterium]|jgi:putative FmdB family regulatory protein
MPIYEYQCEKCGRRAEYLQKMSDPPKTECESCGGKLEKLISSGGFILKGGGWYKDLYSKKPGGGSSSD